MPQVYFEYDKCQLILDVPESALGGTPFKLMSPMIVEQFSTQGKRLIYEKFKLSANQEVFSYHYNGYDLPRFIGKKATDASHLD